MLVHTSGHLVSLHGCSCSKVLLHAVVFVVGASALRLLLLALFAFITTTAAAADEGAER